MTDYKQNRRLKYLIENVFKVSPVEFSKKYSDTKAVKTYNIISERNGISNNMLVEILTAYPQINKVWLLTGEGEMLVNVNLNTNKLNEKVLKYENETLLELREENEKLREKIKKLKTRVKHQVKLIEQLMLLENEKKIKSSNGKLESEIKTPR